jgi:hypothetical protein
MNPALPLRKRYQDLNSRQQENYNFAKLAAVLADYGFSCLRLSDDWHGADLIAVHPDLSDLKIQLKGRLSVDKKYRGKNLYVAFRDNDSWYLYPHDELCQKVLPKIEGTLSWQERGTYTWPSLPEWVADILQEYQIPASPLPSQSING